uniref:CSON003105 protein n=1 Tax=Culicoides sonorensis TaxID=179676 RepID=A0A336MKN6_CULSO
MERIPYHHIISVLIIIVTQIICGTFGPHDMSVEAYARVVKQSNALQSNNNESLLEGNNNKSENHSVQVNSQLRGRAIQSSSSDVIHQQQQQYQYLMKPHSHDSKMIVYPSSYADRRNEMSSNSNLDQDIRRLKKPLPKPDPKPMKSGYQYSKPSVKPDRTNPTSNPIKTTSFFLPTIIPDSHALFFNNDFVHSPDIHLNPPNNEAMNSAKSNEMSLAVTKNNIKDELMKELIKSGSDTNFPPNHQSSYDTPSEVDPIGSSYIPPASGPVKIYPVYTREEKNSSDFDPSLHVFPPNSNVTYTGTNFMLSPGTSYIPPASGIPGQSKPEGFKANPYLPPRTTTSKKPTVIYLPPKLNEINEMGVKEPETSDDLNAFPPNIHSIYRDEMEKANNYNKVPETSYLPAPSGNVEDTENESMQPNDEYLPPSKGLNSFPPNIDIEYLPPEMQAQLVGDSYIPPPSGNQNDFKTPPTYLPPVSYLPPTTTSTPKPPTYLPPVSYLPPTTTTPQPVTIMTTQTMKPPVMISYLPPSAPAPPPPQQPPQILLPTPVPQYLPPSAPQMMMPSGMDQPSAPEITMPSDAMLKHIKPWDDPHSDIVFDDPHHHHHDHQHHEIYFDHHDIITTTQPPPPPPPPSIKKYGHYYLLIKLWYVPLIFTIWFSFYIAFILLKSLGRHKAYWPNHTKLRKRSIIENSPLDALSSIFAANNFQNLSHKQITDRVDDLT